MASLVYEDFPGTTTEYKVNFEYMEQSDVKVGFITEEEILTPITAGWSWKDATTIEFESVPGGTIRIYRVTNIDEPVAVFYPTVAIRAIDLNNNFDQCLFKLQELDTDVNNIDLEIEDIKDEINDINDIILDLSGITILANVAALNDYDPPNDSVGSAVQVSNSTGWSGANNITGTPDGFVGGTTLRVALRIANDVTPSYTFISYNAADPDNRYVNQAGDTMTGPLVLSGAPQADLQASTKKYVDDSVNNLPSDINTTYDYGAASNGSNVQLQLVGSDSSTDVVTITPGSNITLTDRTSTGFTINAAGSTGPGTTDLSWANQTETTGEVTSNTGNNATLSSATTSLAGLMSSTDKTTLDSIPATYQTQTGMSAYLVKDFTDLDLLP